MTKVDFNTVIDISSVIWDENDFKANKFEYYNLISGVAQLFEKTKNLKCSVLLRDELLTHMIEGFPFYLLPDKFYEFGNIIYSFLGKVGSNFITYSDTTLQDLNSIPNQIKDYYNDSTKKEVKYLISKIHSENQSKSKFFTFLYLWRDNDKLTTKTNDKTNIYETIIVDNGDDLDNFFDQFRLIFEHKSPKHDCAQHKNKQAWDNKDDKGSFESQLSCFCDGNRDRVQDILDKRYHKCFGNEFYYGYDDDNGIYVVFRKTSDNIYHAYDMYDIEKVPQEVKNTFRVWRYKN